MGFKQSNRTGPVVAIVLLAVAWIGVSASMARKGSFNHEPNFMWLKGSGYGRTIAFAMRGPTDLYWHRGGREDLIEEHHDDHDGGEVELIDIDKIENPGAHMVGTAVMMKREFDEHEAAEAESSPERPPAKSVREFLLRSLKDMKIARYERTNAFGDTNAMFSFMKGEAEKRMKLSYEMDPTNLVCYGSYFFFLSESVVRLHGAGNEAAVIAEGEQRALALASQTVNSCLELRDEPTAMITCASACHDALTILLRRGTGTEVDLRSFHGIGSGALVRFDDLRTEMVTNGRWAQFSEHRQKEMDSARNLLAVALVGDIKLIDERFKAAPVDTP